jgi:N-methylhydantoinase B
VTLVTPVDVDGDIIGYAVSRAHHSDVGGMTPGSMPSGSRSIFQEGIIIPPLRLVRRGIIVEDLLELLLANVRTPAIRRADLLAQLAANRVGAERLSELVDRHGLAFVRTAFGEVITYGERRARAAIRALPDGTYTAAGELEGDGVVDVDIPICVSVTIDDDVLRVDFAGTAGPVAGNVNCPRSVTLSACLFAVRVALPNDMPTNAGSASPIEMTLTGPSLVDARKPAAVVAGNVETSQRIADILLAALGQAVDLPAAGQGTMNNLIIGGSDWTYYETIGGGQGGSGNGPGASGVHVGMSNTLNTPVEALELEYPLRVERYQLRYGTGGAGLHAGGDGIERRLRFLEPATLSVISDRRRHRPAGKAGGGDGECGENLVDDVRQAPKFSCEVRPGQVVSVLTPGGGGFGTPEPPAT